MNLMTPLTTFRPSSLGKKAGQLKPLTSGNGVPVQSKFLAQETFSDEELKQHTLESFLNDIKTAMIQEFKDKEKKTFLTLEESSFKAFILSLANDLDPYVKETETG